MTRLPFLLALTALLAFSVPNATAGPTVEEAYGPGPKTFSLATGSPGELGLLKVLGEAYCAKAGCRLDWIKAGSGQSLDMLKAGAVDMIMVHAPAAEKKAVAEGWAGCPTLIGSNEFFLVGPAADPAGIAKAASAADAYRRIAEAKAKFFSRGDNSGTHKKELDTWKDAGIAPAGDWYVVTKAFMTATLTRANDEGGYFMTDSSTWAAEKKNTPKLKVLFSGDKKLVNTYHALCGQKDGKPASAVATGFIAFVASPEGQALLDSFGKDKYGEALYNDAAYAKKYVD
ncbi:putative ABC transporter substrate binding protein precursor [Solidesulfovibrio carbinoliphilus subsp. oakridgensis]|uniref:ABC transporter substrate binding protein n=1 Tax=Solidesulfovibrio carbinoliphilus subsp. oakridgensis TaxID=694327 RepID=G7QAC6_9BACT|nr:substrate-binding domain-containing protein [Solidesulfovibrio carbinoliphilus]EHJ48277.1 putative ABC transporter substrate binding protein precursor [Solidesulfovibrio carbinoliphilus subsp. oakridgensis]